MLSTPLTTFLGSCSFILHPQQKISVARYLFATLYPHSFCGISLKSTASTLIPLNLLHGFGNFFWLSLNSSLATVLIVKVAVLPPAPSNAHASLCSCRVGWLSCPHTMPLSPCLHMTLPLPYVAGTSRPAPAPRFICEMAICLKPSRLLSLTHIPLISQILRDANRR